MKKIYICSPVRGDQRDIMEMKDNLARATVYSRWVYSQGYFPMCPHIYLQEATGGNEIEEPSRRSELLSLGLEMLTMSDELWVFGREEGKESSGMKTEIKEACSRKMPVKYINTLLLRE